MNKKTLNDILSNYQDLEKDLIENDGELTDDMDEKLRINNLDLSEKLNGYEKFVRYLKHQAEYLKSMEEHYTKRRRTIESSISRCKNSMINAMNLTDNKNIKTEEFNFTVSTSKKWTLVESEMDEAVQKFLIDKGLAENKFKPFISEIKSQYKDKDKPDWIDVIESDYLRVS